MIDTPIYTPKKNTPKNIPLRKAKTGQQALSCLET